MLFVVWVAIGVTKFIIYRINIHIVHKDVINIRNMNYILYGYSIIFLLSRGSGVRIPPGSPKISTLLMQGVFYIFIKVKSLDSHFMV